MLIIASQSSEKHRLILINRKSVKELYFYRDELLFLSIGYTSFSSHPEKIDQIPPDFTISAVTKFAFPIADINISASFAFCARFCVLEWHDVTVAFLFRQQCINGFPTILLLPNITTFFPVKSILYSSNIFIIPYGVHDTKVS